MLDADAISQYVDSDKFEVALSNPTSTRHIVLNTTNEILSDTAVRQALQHATNRTAISEGIFMGWSSRQIRFTQLRFLTVM